MLALLGVGRHVVIDVNDESARRQVAAMFAAFVQSSASNPVAQLALKRRADRWVVTDATLRECFEGSLEGALWLLRYEVTRALMTARPDLVWLHASALVGGGRAMLIAGPSGSGKSTLAARLIGRGFCYLGDETIPFDPQSSAVLPFAIAPVVREDAPHALTLAARHALPKHPVRVSVEQLAPTSCPVSSLVFPSTDGETREPERLSRSRAAMELLGHCLELSQRPEQIVPAAGALARVCSAVRLPPGDVESSARFAEAFHLRTLEQGA